MSTFQHRNNLISQSRQHATALLSSLAGLEACAAAWNGRGIKLQIVDATGADPAAGGYKANDFLGHEGLMKADVNQALGAALDNLRTFMQTADGKKFEDIAL